jgi:hypothetical protein
VRKKLINEEPKFYESKDFKKLRDEWYKKLEDTGFEEAEDVDSVNEFMIRWHSKDIPAKGTWDQLQARAAYYNQALSYWHTAKFKNAVEREVWYMHSEGYTIKEIASKIKKYKKTAIHGIILRIRRACFGY